jgi:hypothetical protein
MEMFMITHKDVDVSAKKKYTDFKVKVFGLEIPIKFIPHVYDRQGNLAAGMFTRDEDGQEVIFISTEDNTSHKAIVETIFHECAHAVIYRLGLHNTTLSHDVEEVIVDGIGVFLAENFEFDI